MTEVTRRIEDADVAGAGWLVDDRHRRCRPGHRAPREPVARPPQPPRGRARSRARLAADLGLNKATVSSLVTELRERGLVREGSAERGAVGRPGTIVEIDGAGAYGLGAEINVHHVSTRAVDLAGVVVSERRTSVDTRASSPTR